MAENENVNSQQQQPEQPVEHAGHRHKDHHKHGRYEQELHKLREEKQNIFEQLQRLSAEFANFQKREPKRIADAISSQKESLIRSILPVLDNFERAVAGAENAQDMAAVIKGVHIVYEQFMNILKSFGVEQVVSVGGKFDPAMHEALMQRSDPDKDEGIILEEFQKGYMFNGRMLRPAKVVVNAKPKPAVEPPAGEPQNDETTDTKP